MSLRLSFFLMVLAVASSNFLVQYPINDWLTWGALPYPTAYLITELVNVFYGPKKACLVVYVGFFVAVLFSFFLATPKIACASGFAFLVSQLLDVYVFNRLRRNTWWYAPFFSSVLASSIDTALFWSLAFYGEEVPLLTWAIGDTFVKLSMDVLMLTPFRFFIRKIPV